MRFAPPSRFRFLPLIAAALLAIGAAPAAQAQPLTAPQTLGGEPVVELATGSNHSCALVASGRVWCWGRNDAGQLGDGAGGIGLRSPAPVLVQGLTNVTQIAAGGASSCALRNTGRIFCWGANGQGQLGDGTTTNRLTPVRVRVLTDVSQIAVGGGHACALRLGRAHCWGRNDRGQVGDGTLINRLEPTLVAGTLNKRVAQVVAGFDHSCLLPENRLRVRCWGANTHGQLGNGTRTNSPVPVTVSSLLGVQQISAGTEHTCARSSAGSVSCWGRNEFGEVGDGTQIRRTRPVRVQGLTRVVQVDTESSHSCAVRDTGRVFCWGRNSVGELGDGTNDMRLTPVRVAGLVNATRVTLGLWFSCGLRADGQAFCWGTNFDGQLGDGTRTNRRTPVQVTN